MSTNGRSDDHDANGHLGGKLDEDALSEAQMELLRQALIEHGKRIGELETKMDKSLGELLMIKEVIARTHARMKKIAQRLGIDPNDL